MKKLILLLIAGMFFTGCATSSVQTGPAYLDWNSGKKKFDAKIVLADTGLFTPSTADTLMLECLPTVSVVAIDPNTGERRVVANDLEDEELLAESRCQIQADIEHDATAGAAASFIAPVLNSAALAYVGHEIGKGIGKSGDRTTNSNNSRNTADAEADSEADAEADAVAGANADAFAEADSEADASVLNTTPNPTSGIEGAPTPRIGANPF